MGFVGSEGQPVNNIFSLLEEVVENEIHLLALEVFNDLKEGEKNIYTDCCYDLLVEYCRALESEFTNSHNEAMGAAMAALGLRDGVIPDMGIVEACEMYIHDMRRNLCND